MVWNLYTDAAEIKEWNTASADWHTTDVKIALQEGGQFCYHMAAKDGSVAFDFEGVFTKIIPNKLIAYDLSGRNVTVEFMDMSAVLENDLSSTLVTIRFEPESILSNEQQQQGWQAILDNFKEYVETHEKS